MPFHYKRLGIILTRRIIFECISFSSLTLLFCIVDVFRLLMGKLLLDLCYMESNIKCITMLRIGISFFWILLILRGPCSNIGVLTGNFAFNSGKKMSLLGIETVVCLIFMITGNLLLIMGLFDKIFNGTKCGKKLDFSLPENLKSMAILFIL